MQVYLYLYLKKNNKRVKIRWNCQYKLLIACYRLLFCMSNSVGFVAPNEINYPISVQFTEQHRFNGAHQRRGGWCTVLPYVHARCHHRATQV